MHVSHLHGLGTGFLSVLATKKILLHVLELVGRLPTYPDFPGMLLVCTSYLGTITYSTRFTLCFHLEKDLNGHLGLVITGVFTVGNLAQTSSRFQMYKILLLLR